MPLPANITKSIRRQAGHMLETGQRFKRFDQIRQRHFWSTYLFTPDVNGYITSGEFDIFVTPAGQVGQGFPVSLTGRETNWNSANRVPDNQNLEITEIGVTLQPIPTAVDAEATNVDQQQVAPYANQFVQNTVVAIRYLTNSVELGMASDFSQPSGPVMGTYVPLLPDPVQSTRTKARYMTNGFAGPGLRRRFKIPILLQHGETFAFRYIIPRTFYSNFWSFQACFDFWATESFVERS